MRVCRAVAIALSLAPAAWAHEAACTAYMTARGLAGKYEGVQLKILQPAVVCGSGGAVYGMGDCFGSFEAHVADFCNCTGATTEWSSVSGGLLEATVNKDLSGDKFFDIYIVRTRMVIGPANNQKLHDMQSTVGSLTGDQYLDMFATVRQWDTSYTIGGEPRVFFMPLDSDLNALSLTRPELVDDADATGALPRTWDELLALATKYHHSANVSTAKRGDVPLRGFCTYCGSAGTSIGLWQIVAPVMQSLGTSQGVFFNPSTFATYFKTEAFRYGAALWKELAKFTEDRDGCSRHSDYPECLYMLISPTKGLQRYKERQRIAPTPGSTRVANADGSLRTCLTTDSTDCPFADTRRHDVGAACADNAADQDIPELVNRAPFYVSPWTGAIRAGSDTGDEDFSREVAAHLLVSANVEMSWGAYADPWRSSQIAGAEDSFESDSWRELVCAYDECGSHPNRAADLRIVGATSEYYGAYSLATDQAESNLDLLAANYLKDLITLDEFVEQADAWWNELSDCGGKTIDGKTANCAPLDRMVQHNAYRRSLALEDLTEFQSCQLYQSARDATDGPQFCARFHVDVEMNRFKQHTVVIGYTLLVMVMAMALAFVAFTLYAAKSRVVRNSQPLFLYLLAMGCVINALTIIPLSIDDKISHFRANCACMVAPWTFLIGWSIAFGSLAAKTERVRRLFASADKFRFRVIPPTETLKPIVALLVVDCCVLLAWTLHDPLVYRRVERDGDSRGRCESKNAWAYFAPLLALHTLVLLVATVIAYKVRHVDSDYHESQYIFGAMYVTLQIAILGVPVLFIVAQYATVSFIVRSFVLFSTNTSTLMLIFVPKIRAYYKNDGRARCERSNSVSTSRGGSSSYNGNGERPRSSSSSTSPGSSPSPARQRALPPYTPLTSPQRDSDQPRKSPYDEAALRAALAAQDAAVLKVIKFEDVAARPTTQLSPTGGGAACAPDDGHASGDSDHCTVSPTVSPSSDGTALPAERSASWSCNVSTAALLVNNSGKNPLQSTLSAAIERIGDSLYSEATPRPTTTAADDQARHRDRDDDDQHPEEANTRVLKTHTAPHGEIKHAFRTQPPASNPEPRTPS